MQEHLYKLKNCLILRWYSVRTQKSYISAVKLYIQFIRDRIRFMPRNSVDKVKHYLLFLHNQNKAPKTINLSLFAIKFFYLYVLQQPLVWKIYTCKNVKKLPGVFSRNEIKMFLDSIFNPKHKLMMMLAYGSGLRVSEVVNLKIGNVDFDRGLLNIRSAKWKKDRIVMIPQKIVRDLKKYILNRNFDDILFESERWWKLTTRTCQNVFKKICNKTWINKKLTFHSLRHSFATHLLETGLDVTYVQKLLWHSSVKTTQNYLHIANTELSKIASPLDK